MTLSTNGTAETDFRSYPYSLDQLFTVEETMSVLGKKSKPELLGKGRIAEKFQLGGIKIGGTKVFPIVRVEEVGRKLSANPLRGGPLMGEEAKQAEAEYNRRLREVKKGVRKKSKNRNWNLSDIMTIDEVQAALGNLSRQSIYSMSDWHGGQLRTQVIGRTRVWLKVDVEAAANDV